MARATKPTDKTEAPVVVESSALAAFLEANETFADSKRSFVSNAGKPFEVRVREKFITGLEAQIELIKGEIANGGWKLPENRARDPRWYYQVGSGYAAGLKYGVREVVIGAGKLKKNTLKEVQRAYEDLIELAKDGHFDATLLPLAQKMSDDRTNGTSKPKAI